MGKRKAILYSTICSTLLFCFYFVVSLRQAWAHLLSNSGAKSFGDLRIVTTSSGCYVNEAGLDFFDVDCSIWGSNLSNYPSLPYNYPGIWARFLSVLSVTEQNTVSIGILFFTIFSISIGILIYLSLIGSLTAWPAFIIFPLALSPAALLGVERGNTDLLVFGILVFGILLLVLNRSWLSVTFFSFAAFLKIFPLGAFIVLLARPDRQKKFFVAACLLTTLSIFTYFEDLAQIANRTPTTQFVSFGVAVLPLHIAAQMGISLTLMQARITGLTIFIAISSVIWLTIRIKPRYSISSWWHRSVLETSADKITQILIISGLGSTIFAYLLGSSFEYRLILMIIFAAGLSRMIFMNSPRTWPLLALTVFVVFESVSVDPYAMISDLILLLLMPFLFIWGIAIIVQSRKVKAL